MTIYESALREIKAKYKYGLNDCFENDAIETAIDVLERIVSLEKEGVFIMNKTEEIKFRVTEEEKKEIEKMAEEQGRTMSNLLRYLVAKERKEREK